MAQLSSKTRSMEKTCQNLEDGVDVRNNTKMEFCNVLNMCTILASLNVTLKRQSLESQATLQEIAFEKFKDSNFDLNSKKRSSKKSPR